MSIAYITGGQYVPMQNAKLLAQVIIGGVKEEISIEKLMQDVQEDIEKEMKQAEAEGVNEEEIATRVNHMLLAKNIKSKQFQSPTSISVAAKEQYSKYSDMGELRKNYKIEPSSYSAPGHATKDMSYSRRAAKSKPASYIGGLLSSLTGEQKKTTVEESEDAPPTEMTYGLKEEQDISMEQTERIVQKMRSRK
ncbi:unnamed protein product [Didymodactylos carnosus]|uniref:Uncharacterized protein n=2 Tax=Didymodactylos carnosus TaxID=1234261 RepID=A0A815E5E4_9BILA|nr:unnamed protein product [Didymodactylos carnosus]CAF4140582.1 unnamed protein product [Didymodactylos carnosus]